MEVRASDSDANGSIVLRVDASNEVLNELRVEMASHPHVRLNAE